MENNDTRLFERGLSLFHLKCIAMIAMTCDHVGAVFFSSQVGWRLAGRLAFPIYCFLIANGFFHTSSKFRYLSRLILFAALSQIPFSMMRLVEHGHTPLYLFRNFTFCFDRLNSLFVLSLGLIAIWILDILRQRFHTGGHLLGILACAGIGAGSYFIHCDYSFLGVPLILAFYEGQLCFRRFKHAEAAAMQLLFGTAALALYVLLQVLILHGKLSTAIHFGIFQFAALLILLAYSGKRGAQTKILKYCFYFFYPAHILLIVILYTVIFL